MGYLIGFISFLLLIIISGCGTIYKPVDQRFDISDPVWQSYVDNMMKCDRQEFKWRESNERKTSHLR